MRLLLKNKENSNDLDYVLCDDHGDNIVSFCVEVEKNEALISYVTEKQFRNKGFASLGLNMLKDILFSESDILFLNLIDLSSDYSRKVAENAGFFSPSNSLDYYVSVNPKAEIIIDDLLQKSDQSSTNYKKVQRLQKKLRRLRNIERQRKEIMKNKLESLLQEVEIVESDDYKRLIESEIHHIQNILGDSQNNGSHKR